MDTRKTNPDGGGEQDSRSTSVGRADPLVGSLVAEKYRIVELIAQGGMGRVYQAEQLPLGRVCAVKILRPKQAFDAADPNVQKRFTLEAATCARLTHPNTVTLYDYGQIVLGGRPTFFMVMELVNGRTLADALRADGPFPPLRALGVAREICRSLHEAHQLGIVHRDLKPSNIMLVRTDEGESVKVLDFGIARVLEDGTPDYTQEDSVVGSPRYMSPEQIRHHDVDGRSDIYSLGILLFLMLTGQVPFAKDGVMGTLMAHLTEPVPWIKDRTGQDAPAVVEAIVRRCLDKSPRDRFPNAQALREAIEDAINTVRADEDAALLDTEEIPLQPIPPVNPRISAPPPRPAAPPPPVADTQPRMAPVAPERSRTPIIIAAVLLFVVAVLAWIVGRGPRAPDASAEVGPTPEVATPAVPTSSQLNLGSTPSGAEIWEGDKNLGTTPMAVMVEDRAPHTYELRLSGYKPAPVQFVPTGALDNQQIALEKVAARPTTTTPQRRTPPTAQPPPPKRDSEIFMQR